MQTERSIPELTKDMAFHLGDMFRNELKLAGIEATEGVKSLSGAFVLVVLGAAVGGASLTVALLSAAYALSQVMPLWGAGLIVAAAAAILALLLVQAGRAALKPKSLSLPRTREHVSRDLKTISEQVH
jgi:cytochrome c biogenesis protein CcdA